MKLLMETLPCVKSLYHLLCLSVHVCILCLTLLEYKQHKGKDTVSLMVTTALPVLGTVTGIQQVLNKCSLTVTD